MAVVPDDSAVTLSRLIPQIILASKSPARKALLEDIGCQVIVRPTETDEYHGSKVGPQVVHALAKRKLDSYLSACPDPDLPVLAADTLVGFAGHLLGKSPDMDHARQHIRLLSDASHSVYSAFALYLPPTSGRPERILSGSDEAIVTFRSIDEDELERYLAAGDWRGAAGSYRIQGEAKSFIVGLSGDFATVVGLPIRLISAILSSPGCL